MKIQIDRDFLPYLRSIPGPYARGNRASAIREQIINSYDADATQIKITFKGFGKRYQTNAKSKILFHDNGDGISLEMLQDWFKYEATTKKGKPKTRMGKKPKGGAGKGRVGTFLLGNKGKITSEPKGDNKTHILQYDLNKSTAEIRTEISTQENKGQTIIEISELNGKWSEIKIIALCDKLIRLYRRIYLVKNAPCEVAIYKDEKIKFYILYELASKSKIWQRIMTRLAVLAIKRATAIATMRF